MYLLILCAVTTGCGTSAERNAETERLDGERKGEAEKRAAKQKAAAEKKAAEDKAAAEKEAAEEKAAAEKKAAEKKAAANSYVKVKVDVELRGVLSYTEEAVTIRIGEKDKWVLDFGADKEMRAKAKGLDGKTVLVEGSAILRSIRTPKKRGGELDPREMTRGEEAFLDLEPKVAVKSLVAATKE
jgi:membrane protein involved in colicin uptake